MEEKNKVGNVEANEEQVSIKSTSTPYSEFFYFTDIYNEKLYKNFLKNIEKTIRTSREYNEYIAYLHSFGALSHDNIMINVDDGDATIEMHHYPFSLFDIVDIVVSYNLINKKKITTFSIAKEIMDLHFKNYIGLVPLTETMHQLAHDGQLFLSTKQIFGNIEKFIEIYNDGISADLKFKLAMLKDDTEKNLPSDRGGLLDG